MMEWYKISKLRSKNFVCGHCGNYISSENGYSSYGFVNEQNGFDNDNCIYICHHCNSATFFNNNKIQTPSPLFGKQFLVDIPELINELYNEARKCYSVNAFTSVGLCCRKLLMHIGVDLGAKEGLNFIEYVDYLSEENYIPKNSKKWVDIIRTKGNEATHEIVILSQEDAKKLIQFSEIILNLVYENELLLTIGDENEIK